MCMSEAVMRFVCMCVCIRVVIRGPSARRIFVRGSDASSDASGSASAASVSPSGRISASVSPSGRTWPGSTTRPTEGRACGAVVFVCGG